MWRLRVGRVPGGPKNPEIPKKCWDKFCERTAWGHLKVKPVVAAELEVVKRPASRHGGPLKVGELDAQRLHYGGQVDVGQLKLPRAREVPGRGLSGTGLHCSGLRWAELCWAELRWAELCCAALS